MISRPVHLLCPVKRNQFLSEVVLPHTFFYINIRSNALATPLISAKMETCQIASRQETYLFSFYHKACTSIPMYL